jgi:transmembrane sensor
METPKKSDAVIAERAREWIRRLASGEVDAADLDALKAWLADDPSHAAAFERERGFWQDLEPHRALFAQATSASLGQVPRLGPRRWNHPATRRVLVSAIAASLVLAVTGPSLLLHLRADHLTGAGEARSFALPDRSTVVLDTGSAIAVRYGDSERRVELLRGRAWFRVAHGDPRPFRVAALGGVTQDIGTAFEVAREDDGVDVSVSEGRVRMTPAPDAPALALHAGERARYRDGLAKVLADAAPDRIAAWRDGELLIDDMPLGDALQEIARYRHGETLIWADTAGKPRVSGVFRTDRPDDALAALMADAGLSMIRLPAETVIIR